MELLGLSLVVCSLQRNSWLRSRVYSGSVHSVELMDFIGSCFEDYDTLVWRKGSNYLMTEDLTRAPCKDDHVLEYYLHTCHAIFCQVGVFTETTFQKKKKNRGILVCIHFILHKLCSKWYILVVLFGLLFKLLKQNTSIEVWYRGKMASIRKGVNVTICSSVANTHLERMDKWYILTNDIF